MTIQRRQRRHIELQVETMLSPGTVSAALF
jgi:hypothetical protein